MPGIFISYRRDDTGGYARGIADYLKQKLDVPVFMDIDSVDPGADFVDAIEDAVGSCDVLVALIGNRWLDATDEHGQRRLESPNDFIRVEIAAALERNTRIIPVLLRGASMPRESELPEPLKALTRRQALKVSDERWAYDLERLVDAIERGFLSPVTVSGHRVEKAEPTAPPLASVQTGRKPQFWVPAISALLVALAFTLYWFWPDFTELQLEPKLVFEPDHLDLGGAQIGSQSQSKPVKTINIGKGELSMRAVLMVGDNKQDFTAESRCPDTLPAGESCVIDVKFDPTDVGNRSARLSVISNSPTSPDEVPLSGIGVGSPFELVINGVTFEFVEIPAGRFKMGSEHGYKDEKPAREVEISKPFQLGKYEVTQEQWLVVMRENPSNSKGAKLPVEMVSWNDVQDFLAKLNEPSDRFQYRLPTEAEWEYAARAGTTEILPENLDELAWFGGNSRGKTHPIGEKTPNHLRLYDMLGNVSEWVQDWHTNNYYQNRKDALGEQPDKDPRGPNEGTSKVHRGCGWPSPAAKCSLVNRSATPPDTQLETTGFRLLRQAR